MNETEDGERFLLDATILGVITNRAFRAGLANGHEFVAFRGASETDVALGAGDRVRVEMSPCDMSKGRIVRMG